MDQNVGLKSYSTLVHVTLILDMDEPGQPSPERVGLLFDYFFTKNIIEDLTYLSYVCIPCSGVNIENEKYITCVRSL